MIIQPSNISPRTASGTGPNGTTQWSGGQTLPYTPNVASRTAEPMFYMTAYPLQFDLFSNETAQTPAGEQYEIQVLGRNLHAIQVTMTGTATVLIEGTLDGTNWETVDTITASALKQYSGLYSSLRASISAYTNGDVTATAISQRS